MKIVVLALAAAYLAGPAFAQTAAPASEIDLCRQQLAITHDSNDARERKLAIEHAAAEARAATLIEWLRAAQAGATR